ncbi:MAG: hypothetical protein O6952_08270 [Planctomycetota bacterium]|nr:hypothetical protein [Planctomycetota bacterium]
MKKLLVLLSVVLTLAVVAWAQEDKEKEGKIKEPDKVKTLEDAMEGIGKQSESIGTAIRKKSYDSMEKDARKMLKYIEKAIEFKTPEGVKGDEQIKEYRGLQEKLKVAITKAADEAKDKDFKAARKSMRSASKVCGTCHNKYRPEEEEDHK